VQIRGADNRPREAPPYVSGKFAYFWGQNGPNPCCTLHIFEPQDPPKRKILVVYCIFLAHFADLSGMF